MSWDEGLRDEQQHAAGASREHHVLLAGPGTGKTFVLVRRVEHLVEVHNISPTRITALTFTRAAAAEMRERLEDRLGDKGRMVRVSTLHSYALRELLREGARQLPSPVRVVGDWEERWIVVEELARLLGRSVSEISNGKDGALDRLADDWDTLAADGQGWEEGHSDPQFLTAWRRHREVYGYTLRSELVYQLLCELRSNPDFSPSAKSRVVLVDEYQDLNRCDLDAIQFLVQRAKAELFASGDDDQSIYLFRHAHPAGIRAFTSTYGGTSELKMTECLRCGQAVIDLANWLISQEQNRVQKELVSVTDWDASVHLIRFQNQESEAAGVARIVEREIVAGTPAEEILILMKTDTRGRVSEAVTKSLRELDVKAYLPRGQRQLDESLQVLLEYLILSEQLTDADRLDDLAVRALLALEDNRIGATRIGRLVTFAYEQGVRFTQAIELAKETPDEFPRGLFGRVFDEVDRIVERARALGPREDEDFDAWLLRVCEDLGVSEETVETIIAATHQVATELEDELQAGAPPEDAEAGVAEETAEADEAQEFVQDLLVAMTGLSDTLPARLDDNVTITTMHGAKGLSADVVIILQAEDEVIPDGLQGAEYDEARRLLYVSITRAKRKLLITACNRRTGPQRFVGQQEVVERHLTRFLTDYGLTAYRPDEYLSLLPNPNRLRGAGPDENSVAPDG